MRLYFTYKGELVHRNTEPGHRFRYWCLFSGGGQLVANSQREMKELISIERFMQFRDSLIKSSSEWNTYKGDKETYSFVCALIGAGTATVNEHNQIKVLDEQQHLTKGQTA